MEPTSNTIINTPEEDNEFEASMRIYNQQTDRAFVRNYFMGYAQGHSTVPHRAGLILPIRLGAFILFQVVSDDTAVSR